MDFKNRGTIPLYLEGQFEFNVLCLYLNKNKIKLYKFDGKQDVIKAIEEVVDKPGFKVAGMVDSDLDRLDALEGFSNHLVRTEYHDIFSEWLLRNKDVLRSLIVSNSQGKNKSVFDSSSALDVDKILEDALEIARSITAWRIVNYRNERELKFTDKDFANIISAGSSIEDIRNFFIDKYSDSGFLDEDLSYLSSVSLQEYISFVSIDKFIGDHDLMSSVKRSLQLNGIKFPSVGIEKVSVGLSCEVVKSSPTIKKIGELLGVDVLS